MEPNDSIALASVTNLMFGATLSIQDSIGNLTFQNFAQTSPALDVDFYRVEMAKGDILSINIAPVSGSSLNPGIKIFDQNGIPLLSEFLLSRFDFIAPTSSPFFVAVSDRDNVNYNPSQILSGTPLLSGTGGNYSLSLTKHPGDLQSEPNNTIGTAILTGLSTEKPGAFVKSGFIDPGDVDLFQVFLTEGDRLKVKTKTLRESSLDTFLRLFDLQGNVLAINDDASGSNRDSYLEFVAPRSGTYIIGLSDRSNVNYSPTIDSVSNSRFGGGYIISVAVDGAPPEQINDDVPATALATGLSSATPGSRVFNGAIGNNPLVARGLDRDLYAVEISAGDKLTVRVDTPALSDLDSVLRIFDWGGREVAFNDDRDSSTRDSFLEFIAPVSGRFFVGVSDFTNNNYNPFILASGKSGTTGSYRLTINLDGNIPLEPNDSLTQAKPIELTNMVQISEYIGNNPFLPAQLDVDFYKLDLMAGMSITVDVFNLSLSSGLIPGLKIFDESGNILAEDRSAQFPQLSGQFKTSTIRFSPISSGKYFIGVSDVDNFNYNPRNPGSGGFNGEIGTYQLTIKPN